MTVWQQQRIALARTTVSRDNPPCVLSLFRPHGICRLVPVHVTPRTCPCMDLACEMLHNALQPLLSCRARQQVVSMPHLLPQLCLRRCCFVHDAGPPTLLKAGTNTFKLWLLGTCAGGRRRRFQRAGIFKRRDRQAHLKKTAGQHFPPQASHASPCLRCWLCLLKPE